LAKKKKNFFSQKQFLVKIFFGVLNSPSSPVPDTTFKSFQTHLVRSKKRFSRNPHEKGSFFEGNVAFHFFFVLGKVSFFIFFSARHMFDVFDVFDVFDDLC